MDLDHERVSFSIRIVLAKFRAISSSFDHSKGVACKLGKIECFSGKLESSFNHALDEPSEVRSRFDQPNSASVPIPKSRFSLMSVFGQPN